MVPQNSKSAMQACPSATEMSRVPRSWPAGILPTMDRHPDVIAKVNQEYLAKAAAGAVKTFFDTQCRQYALRKATEVKNVVDYFGVSPQPVRAGSNETALCSDYNGVYSQFYKCGALSPPCRVAFLSSKQPAAFYCSIARGIPPR
jgi:hypothetical protein